MDVTELTPIRALRVMTPAGLVLATRFESPPPSWHRRPWRASLTVAWERDGEEAARMMGHVDRVAREILGADAPMLVRSGEMGIPLRDGDRDRPGDARLAGRVFAEIEGDLSSLLDARRQPPRPLDLRDAAAREFAGPQSLVCAEGLRALPHAVPATLRGGGTVMLTSFPHRAALPPPRYTRDVAPRCDTAFVSQEDVARAIDALVDECRSVSLWFLRPDYYPRTDEERRRVLYAIQKHADVDVFKRAARLERWLYSGSTSIESTLSG